MLNEALRKVIEESLRQSYQNEDDAYTTKHLAHLAALHYGQKHGWLGEPASSEEQAAIMVAVETVINQTPRHQLMAMKSLEFIAENYFMYKGYSQQGKISNPSSAIERYEGFLGKDKSRPWIARITGFDMRHTFARTFIRGQIDYSQASGNGSRGVYLHFWLKPGIYEVNERLTWRRVRRYFIQVENIEITEISKEQVEAWIQSS